MQLGDATFFKVSKKKDAKKTRVAKFQELVDAGRVHLVSGCYLLVLFDQLEKYLGTKTNSGRKDDAADVCGMLAESLATS